MQEVKTRLLELANQRDLIDITLCCCLYRVCKVNQFDDLTGTDFAQLLNLREVANPIKVRRRENTRVCYMIYVLSSFIGNATYAKAWAEIVLKKCNITFEHYNSHHNDPVSTKTKENIKFTEAIHDAIKIAQTM
jgi:hypothetical protein